MSVRDMVLVRTHLMMVSKACTETTLFPLLSPFLPQSMPEMIPKSTSRTCFRAWTYSLGLGGSEGDEGAE